MPDTIIYPGTVVIHLNRESQGFDFFYVDTYFKYTETTLATVVSSDRFPGFLILAFFTVFKELALWCVGSL